MIDRHRCAARSPATARRCTREINHLDAHEARTRSGRRLEEWPRALNDADAPTVITRAELLEHLRDLIDLAKSEQWGVMVAALERADRTIRGITYARSRRRRARIYLPFTIPPDT